MGSIWAIADLHLSWGTPDKGMELFGKEWEGHFELVRCHWLRLIKKEDLVLLAGDFSWAKNLEQVAVDLAWLDLLPGEKILIRGNHDYWWSSKEKIKKVLPSSIHIIQNDHYVWDDVAIGGARLWDTEEYNFSNYTLFKENPKENKQEQKQKRENDKIFARELERLSLSLASIPENIPLKIAMTHYPPISGDLQPSQASLLLEKKGVNICVFGHLHSLVKQKQMFGSRNGVKYLLTSCDYLNFCPILVRGSKSPL